MLVHITEAELKNTEGGKLETQKQNWGRPGCPHKDQANRFCCQSVGELHAPAADLVTKPHVLGVLGSGNLLKLVPIKRGYTCSP